MIRRSSSSSCPAQRRSTTSRRSASAWTTASTRNPDGTAVISAWATDEQAPARARARLRGGRDDHQQVRDRRDPRRAHRDAEAEIKAAKDALRENAAGKKGASAAPGSIRAQRADYFENNVGRFLSIEANVDGASFGGTNGTTYNGPTVMAEWFDAAGNRIGGAVDRRRLPRPRRQPGLLPVPLRGLPGRQQGRRRRPCPRRSRSRPRTATSTRSPSRSGSPRTRRSRPAPLTGFVTHYNDSHEAYGKMRAPRHRVPEHLRGHQAAGEDARLPAPGADDARLHERDGHRADRDGRVRPLRRQQPARSPARRRPRPSRPARSS